MLHLKLPLVARWSLLAIPALASHSAPTGVIEPLPAMRVARMAHSATPLADGKVLIAGGFSSRAQAGQSAELFDPAIGRFEGLPSMVVPRHSHTATRLRDGRVLITGGYGEGNAVIASAEVYDPATRRFLPAGTLRTPRAGHGAALLDDGSVLLVGGVGREWSFLASAERYDPARGTFTPTGAMSVARESHAVVRLADGHVLIVGGHRGRRSTMTIYASAEVYDPRTGRFTPAGDMSVARHKHDAVLLADGRVLVTGGSDERDDQGMFTSTEWFDPTTLRFRPGPPLQHARYKHQGSSLLLSDGSALIAGGAERAERFDPATNRFHPVAGTAALPGRFSAVSLLPDGGALITGGYGSGRGPQAAAWRYRP